MIISSIHALTEALKDGKPVSRVWIANERRGRGVEQIKDLCRQKRIVFQMVPSAVLDRKAGGPHQGVCGEVAPIDYYSLETVLRQPNPGLLLVLDGIEDTGNLGAIIRTAAAVQVDGVVLSMRGSAPVNETVWKTSAGALGKVKIVPVPNLSQAVERIKKAGYWVVATSGHASRSYFDYDFCPPTAIILGSEHRGVSTLLQKRADTLVAIPHAREVESLNVSAAAAVILFEALRQRIAKQPFSPTAESDIIKK